MANLEQFAARIHGLATNPDITYGAIEDTADELVQVNKEHLLEGLGSDGLPLTELNAKFRRKDMQEPYKPFKESMNPRAGGRYDMNFSGASFESMRLKIEAGRYSIVGAGWANRYNEGRVDWAANLRGRIFGIFPSDHFRYYKTQYLYPAVLRRWRNYLNS